MAYATIIARMPDGLILAESQDGCSSGPVAVGRRKAVQVLQRACFLAPRCSVECGGFVFHLSQVNGVCYLAMFDTVYPRNYGFAFLEEIQVLFEEELKREFGTGSVDYRSQIDTIEKPYYFVRLDRHIAKKKAEYRDPSSSRALSRLHAQLMQVSGIMHHNIEEILNRGESLEDVSQKAKQLSTTSQEFSGTAKRLALHTRLGVLIVLGLLAVAVYMSMRVLLGLSTGKVALFAMMMLTSTCLIVLRNQRRRSAKMTALEKQRSNDDASIWGSQC